MARKNKQDEKVIELIPGVLDETVEETVEQPEENVIEGEQTIQDEVIIQDENKTSEPEKIMPVTEEEIAGMSYEEAFQYILDKLGITLPEPIKTTKGKQTGLVGFVDFKNKSEFAKNKPEWLEPSDVKEILRFSKVDRIYIMENKRFAIIKSGNVYHTVNLEKGEKQDSDSLDGCVTWINEQLI